MRKFFYDTLPQWIAGMLPRRVCYFTFIRVVAETTTGRYSNTVVPELTAMEAVKRWESAT